MTMLTFPQGSPFLDGGDNSNSMTLSGLTIVLGANGAGKTTFLETVHGMKDSHVLWNDVSAKVTKSSRGYVAQRPSFFSGSVRKNLEITCRLLDVANSSRATAIQNIAEALSIETLLDRQAHALSSGEIALVAIARAQLSHPRTLLLDEVTANLDPTNTAKVEAAVQDFANSAEHTVLFVSHSLMQAKRLASNIIFISHGQILYSGSAIKFWTDERPDIQNYLSGQLR